MWLSVYAYHGSMCECKLNSCIFLNFCHLCYPPLLCIFLFCISNNFQSQVDLSTFHMMPWAFICVFLLFLLFQMPFYLGFDILGFQDARTSDENERSCVDDLESRKDEVRITGDQSTCSTSRKSDDSHNGDHCSKCSTDQDQDSARSSQTPKESPKEKAIRKLKLEMEENQFRYTPPRVKVKRQDYLYYARKRKGILIYAVHADYYILLRCCAKIALVETRIMHIAVLSLERRLQWLEKRIDHSLLLHSNLDNVCEFCDGDVQNTGNNPIDSSI